jgi:hypothetical protein
MISWQPGMTLEIIEKNAILKAFAYFTMNKTATANALGIAIRTLDSKLKQYSEESEREKQRIREQQITDDQNRERARFGSNYNGAQSAIRLEPTAQVAQEYALPMSKQKEIQELPFTQAVAGHSKKAR